MIVDLFAGPGGWDQGLTDLGIDDVVGVEIESRACATALAAGHKRLEASVTDLDPADHHGSDGLIASPPCQAFSMAGTGHGRAAVATLLEAVHRCTDGYVAPPGAICGDDLRADLTLEPLRWAHALRPRWVALEQVPPVLPLWRAMADVLRAWGYDADARVVNAADYGVPQTRRRAVLIARRDGHRTEWPTPTHHDPSRGASLFGEPWRTLGEALGRTDGAALCATNVRPNAAIRRTDEPAPTMAFGHETPRWVDPDTLETIGRVTVAEVGVLQTFPADYPWTGPQSARFRQAGNAVPPRLAATLLRPILTEESTR